MAAHYLAEGGFIAAVESLNEEGVLDGFGIHDANIHTFCRAILGYAFLRHLNRVIYKSTNVFGQIFGPKIRAFCGEQKNEFRKWHGSRSNAQLQNGVTCF